MRKQEYLHVHGLLLEIARHLAAREAMDDQIFAAYDSYETSENCIYASKQDHHQVVMFLAAAITSGLEQSPGEESMIPAP